MKFVFVASVLLLSACVEHVPPVERIVPDENELVDSLQQKSYKMTRIYGGKLPCADCGGIEQQLILKGDTAGIYMLRETFLQATEDGDEVLISSGEWIRIFKNGKPVYYLSEHNLRDSARIIRYEVAREHLSELNISGKTINPEAYRLSLQSKN